jgi:hypothetical protein
MTTLRNSKVLLCFLIIVISAFAQGSQPMPKIEGESLSGHTVSLPADAQGKITVLIFGFSKASKTPTKAWASKIFLEFGAQPGFSLYQLPVLEDVPRFIRGMVISSMKKGVPENMRDHFVPILHDEAELKRLVNYKEPDDAYLVTLDSGGQIAEQRHGPFSDAAYSQLQRELQNLLEHSK